MTEALEPNWPEVHGKLLLPIPWKHQVDEVLTRIGIKLEALIDEMWDDMKKTCFHLCWLAYCLACM